MQRPAVATGWPQGISRRPRSGRETAGARHSWSVSSAAVLSLALRWATRAITPVKLRAPIGNSMRLREWAMNARDGWRSDHGSNCDKLFWPDLRVPRPYARATENGERE